MHVHPIGAVSVDAAEEIAADDTSDQFTAVKLGGYASDVTASTHGCCVMASAAASTITRRRSVRVEHHGAARMLARCAMSKGCSWLD